MFNESSIRFRAESLKKNYLEANIWCKGSFEHKNRMIYSIVGDVVWYYMMLYDVLACASMG